MVLHPYVAKLVVEAHIDDLHRDAGRLSPSRPERGKTNPRRWRLPVPRVTRLRPTA